MISRKEFINELNERERLKKIIKKLIMEATPDPVSPSPHPHTGINVLEDLLKKIIPVIEADFKILTTNPKQRESFRAHIINAIQNSIISLKTTKTAPMEKPETTELSEHIKQDLVFVLYEEISVDMDAEDQFIDIEDKPKPTDQEGFAAGMTGELAKDLTGRNMAFQSFKKFEKSILDAYDLLDDPQDEDLFFTYLITNVKLYFDKFENQLAGTLQEPTTPEYEHAQTEKF
jgi:hypothetical protein